MGLAVERKKRIRPSTETAESARHLPKVTIERGFLVLRWPKEQANQVLDAAGMTLERVVAEYVIPNLDATKTICVKHRGQIIQRSRVPDWRARLRALKFWSELLYERPLASRTVRPSESTSRVIISTDS